MNLLESIKKSDGVIRNLPKAQKLNVNEGHAQRAAELQRQQQQ
jgi:hypothetical protein